MPFLRLPEVKRLTGLSRSSIYLRIKTGHFPPTVSLGGRAVGWVDEEVSRWANERIVESRANLRNMVGKPVASAFVSQ